MDDRALPRVDWIHARTFRDKDLVVHVNKLPLRYPKYSIVIAVDKKERESKFLPISKVGQGMISTDVSRIMNLLSEADEFIRSEMQAQEDQVIADRLEREQRDLDRGKPKPKMGLKAWGRRDKERRRAREQDS